MLGDPTHDGMEYKEQLKKQDRNFALVLLIVWAIWITVGSVFYTYNDGFGMSIGFYQAVNIGYSVGSYPEPLGSSEWFSTFFIIAGAMLAVSGVVFLVQFAVRMRKPWFKLVQFHKTMNESKTKWEYLYHYCRFSEDQLLLICAWIVWVFIMICWSMLSIGWSFVDAVYFAVSSLSTCGCFPIPFDSPNYYYGIVGMFTAIGVPLMILAAASFASLVGIQPSRGIYELLQKEMEEDEENLLRELGIRSSCKEMNLDEFLLLSTIRMKAIPADTLLTLIQLYHSHQQGVLTDNNSNNNNNINNSNNDENQEHDQDQRQQQQQQKFELLTVRETEDSMC